MVLSEKAEQNKILAYLKKHNIYNIKIHGSNYSSIGTPDIICCIDGKFIALELKKAKGGKESEAQKLHGERIIKNGGIYYCVKGYNHFKELINEISQHTKAIKNN